MHLGIESVYFLLLHMYYLIQAGKGMNMHIDQPGINSYRLRTEIVN
jgi:hypothetical protein